jgi:hypothetical protein
MNRGTLPAPVPPITAVPAVAPVAAIYRHDLDWYHADRHDVEMTAVLIAGRVPGVARMSVAVSMPATVSVPAAMSAVPAAMAADVNADAVIADVNAEAAAADYATGFLAAGHSFFRQV